MLYWHASPRPPRGRAQKEHIQATLPASTFLDVADTRHKAHNSCRRLYPSPFPLLRPINDTAGEASAVPEYSPHKMTHKSTRQHNKSNPQTTCQGKAASECLVCYSAPYSPDYSSYSNNTRDYPHCSVYRSCSPTNARKIYHWGRPASRQPPRYWLPFPPQNRLSNSHYSHARSSHRPFLLVSSGSSSSDWSAHKDPRGRASRAWWWRLKEYRCTLLLPEAGHPQHFPAPFLQQKEEKTWERKGFFFSEDHRTSLGDPSSWRERDGEKMVKYFQKRFPRTIFVCIYILIFFFFIAGKVEIKSYSTAETTSKKKKEKKKNQKW